MHTMLSMQVDAASNWVHVVSHAEVRLRSHTQPSSKPQRTPHRAGEHRKSGIGPGPAQMGSGSQRFAENLSFLGRRPKCQTLASEEALSGGRPN